MIDISDYIQLHFYDTCWYWDPTSCVYKGEKIGIISRISNGVEQDILFTDIPEKTSHPLTRFKDLSKSTILYVLDDKW